VVWVGERTDRACSKCGVSRSPICAEIDFLNAWRADPDHFFGGMGLTYLFPAAFFMWALMVYGGGQNGYHVAGTAISLIS
jgi:hypothetical protein